MSIDSVRPGDALINEMELGNRHENSTQASGKVVRST
jgi:hypothetical protein